MVLPSSSTRFLELCGRETLKASFSYLTPASNKYSELQQSNAELQQRVITVFSRDKKPIVIDQTFYYVAQEI